MTQITNEALQYFDDMTSLESLSVGRTNVNNDGMDSLSQLSALRILDLNLTGVNDEGLTNLANLTNLEYLDLWNAEVTDESLVWIGTLTNLEVLGLEGTPITDAGLAHLRNLVNMENLNLQTTPVTNAGVELLSELTSLTNLNLRNTRVSDAIVDFIVRNYDLQRYNLPRQISPELWARMEGRPRYSVGTNRKAVHVRDGGTGKPVANAEMEVKWRDTENVTYTPHYFWSDESGDATFYVSYNHTADVSVYADGYVPATEVWETGQASEITIMLRPASMIGGYVVDESGAVVEDVEVHLSVVGERDYVHDVLAQHMEITASDGRWACEHAPRDLSEFSIDLEHPDYATTTYTPAELSPARLKSASERLVIGKGFDISGTVVDGEENSIIGAVIVELETRRYGRNAATTNTAKTDEQGTFKFSNQESGPIKLKIDAGGYLPLIEDVEFHADAEPFRFTLKLGMILRGQVVTHAGQPIEGVRIEIPQNIPNGNTTDASVITWKTVTDKEGRFFWDEAPEEAVPLRFTKPGYARLNKELTATEEEVIVVMGPMLALSGTVQDAETQQSVPEIRMEIEGKQGNRTSRTSVNGIYQDGRYKLVMDQHFGWSEAEQFKITVHAEGYLSSDSRWVKADEGKVTLDFELQPVTPITGTVVDGDGEPVAGVEVFVFSAEKHAYLLNNAPRNQGGSEEKADSVSDEKGTFTLFPPSERCSFFTAGEEGYALLPDVALDGSPHTLELQPWGQVRFNVALGANPDAEADLYLNRIPEMDTEGSSPHIQWRYRGQTDKKGALSFPRLVPGDYRVNIQGKTLVDTSSECSIAVRPGESIERTLGGNGRPVIASLEYPMELKDRINWDRPMVLLRERLPAPKLPEGNTEWTNEQIEAWRTAWLATDEGKAYRVAQNEMIRYRTGVKDFRTLRIEDVEPGDYTLSIRFQKKTDDTHDWNAPVLGTIERTVTIAPIEGGRTDEPKDLGILTLAQ